MKKLFLTAATVTLLLTTTVPAFAANASIGSLPLTASGQILGAKAPKYENKYRLFLNEKAVKAKVYTVGNCIMVPLHTVAKGLEFTVTKNNDGTMTLDTGAMYSKIKIGRNQYIAHSSMEGVIGTTAPFKLGSAPVRIKKVIYVPVELFRVLLGNGEDVVTVKGNQISINTEVTDSVEIPCPITEHRTVEELKKAVAMDFKIPAVPEEYKVSLISDISGELAQVRFSNHKNTICYRVTRESGDNSGVYNEYKNIKEAAVDGVKVTWKGNDNTVSLAIWEKDGYSYSLYSETGLTETEMQDIVKSTF